MFQQEKSKYKKKKEKTIDKNTLFSLWPSLYLPRLELQISSTALICLSFTKLGGLSDSSWRLSAYFHLPCDQLY